MHFSTKSYLKSNRYHTVKHVLNLLKKNPNMKKSQLKKKILNIKESEQKHLLGHLQKKNKFIWLFNDG